jgi:hypothetical protein
MYEKLTDPDVQCDLCGKRPPEEEIYKGKNYIYLCSTCLKKLKAMPEDMKDTVQDYLMGNVL